MISVVVATTEEAAISRNVVSYRPTTLVGSSRMRATLTGHVCASLYCTITLLSPSAHIAQWQDVPTQWRR